MGFYQKQPVDPKKCSVVYLWTGLRTPGIYRVHVEGEAQHYSTGFTLVRDPHFVGGLKIDSMGWTGPIGEGKTPYQSEGSFPGQFYPEIIISGSNGDFPIKVKEFPHDQVDQYVKEAAASA